MSDYIKIGCNCGWRGKGLDLDEFMIPHPFSKETLNFCPACKEVVSFEASCFVACEEPGCWKQATCGKKTPDGYKRLCGGHWRMYSDSDRSKSSAADW